MKTLSSVIFKHGIALTNHSEAFQHTNIYPLQVNPTDLMSQRIKVELPNNVYLKPTARSGEQALGKSWDKVFPIFKVADGQKIYSPLTFDVSAQFELRLTAWPKAMYIEFVEIESGKRPLKTRSMYINIMLASKDSTYFSKLHANFKDCHYLINIF